MVKEWGFKRAFSLLDFTCLMFLLLPSCFANIRLVARHINVVFNNLWQMTTARHGRYTLDRTCCYRKWKCKFCSCTEGHDFPLLRFCAALTSRNLEQLWDIFCWLKWNPFWKVCVKTGWFEHTSLFSCSCICTAVSTKQRNHFRLKICTSRTITYGQIGK